MFSANFAAATTPLMSARLAAVADVGKSARMVKFSRLDDAVATTTTTIDRAPIAAMNELASTRFTSMQAVMVSQEMSAAADQASTSAVASSSLSLNFDYLIVSLSRTPWWNDFMLMLDNWYVPSLHRAQLIADSDAEHSIGVPIAMVLTHDVKIRAAWSASDRAAASSNTHFGPWSLNAAQFEETATAGEAVMTIPGITAIACIYRQLPALPPQADPSVSPGG